MESTRIVFDPQIMGGRACIRGTRIPLATVVRCTASGMTHADIVHAYPELEEEDVVQALQYAAGLTEDRVIPLTPAGS